MKENTKLPLILIIALPILLIISTEVTDISFNLMGQQIYVITFIFPLTFLVSSLISKKAESKIAISIVILSLIIQSCMFILKWALIGTVDYLLMEITFLAFFISQLLLLIGYEVLKETKRMNKFGCVFFLLLIATLVETMFYLFLFTKLTVEAIIITVVVKIIYNLIMSKLLTE